MAKVMPGGPPDQTGFFLARLAASDDALTKLYLAMIEKREERRRNEAHQERMLGLRHQNDMTRLRYQYEDNTPRDTSNPFSTGANEDPLAVTPQPAATPAPAARARPGDPPARFLPGAGGAPSTDRFSSNNTAAENALAAVMPANADDEGPSGDKIPATAAYAQGPAPNATIPGQRARNSRPPGTEPRQPRRPTTQSVDFQKMHPQWVAAMDAAEKKYKLPDGVLMTLYGYENGGGTHLGKNPRSSAHGLFQFTDAVRKQWGVSPQDALNPSVMIDAAAKNLRHNANAYRKLSGKDLPTDSRFIPHWVTLHQWGATDGSLMVNAAISGRNDMPASQVMLQTPKRNNQAILVNNGLPSSATVGDVFNRTASKTQPWYDKGLKLRYPNGAPQTSAQAPTPPADIPTSTQPPSTLSPDQPKPVQTTAVAGAPLQNPNVPNAPRPPADIPEQPRDESVGPFVAKRIGRTPDASAAGVNPRLIAAVRGGAELALPEGYSLRLTSGHRPGKGQSYHATGKASDWQIIKPDGTPISNRGEDTSGLYTRLARGVKTWVTENDPKLLPQMGYGGAFGTQLGGGGVPDLMHYDLGGSRGRMRPDVQFHKLAVLQPNERRAPAQQQQRPPLQSADAATATPLPRPRPTEAAIAAAAPTGTQALKPAEAMKLFPKRGQQPSPDLANFGAPAAGVLGTMGGARRDFVPADIQSITPPEGVPLPQPRMPQPQDYPSIGPEQGLTPPPTADVPLPRPREVPLPRPRPPDAVPLPRPRPNDPNMPTEGTVDDPREFDVPMPQPRPYTPDPNPDIPMSNRWPEPVDPRDDFSDPETAVAGAPNPQEMAENFLQAPAAKPQSEMATMSGDPVPYQGMPFPLQQPGMGEVPTVAGRPPLEELMGGTTAPAGPVPSPSFEGSPSSPWHPIDRLPMPQADMTMPERPSTSTLAREMFGGVRDALPTLPEWQSNPPTTLSPQPRPQPAPTGWQARREAVNARNRVPEAEPQPQAAPAEGVPARPSWLPTTDIDRQKQFDAAAEAWIRERAGAVSDTVAPYVRQGQEMWQNYWHGPQAVPTQQIGNPPTTPQAAPRVDPLDTGVPLPNIPTPTFPPRAGAKQQQPPPFQGAPVGQPTTVPPINTQRPGVMGQPKAGAKSGLTPTPLPPVGGIPAGMQTQRTVDANGNPVYTLVPISPTQSGTGGTGGDIEEEEGGGE